MKKLRIASTTLAVMLLAGSAIQTPAQGNATQGKQDRKSTRDANGDGICDLSGQPVGSGKMDAKGQKAQNGKTFGPGDGTGNMGSGPRDGAGYGAQSGKRLGPQDGSQGGFGRNGAARPGGGMSQNRGGGRR